MTTPPTKCLSKMNKKELYEYCKILGKENHKEEDYKTQIKELEKEYSSMCLDYDELAEKIKKLKEDLKWKDNDLYYANKSNNSNKEWGEYQLKLKKDLEIDLEYFQNKCEIMEKELIKKEED